MTFTEKVQHLFNEHDYRMKQFRREHSSIASMVHAAHGNNVSWRDLHAIIMHHGMDNDTVHERPVDVMQYPLLKTVTVHQYTNN